MHQNNIIIKDKLAELLLKGGALVFALGEHYVQFTSETGSNVIYFEAASHEYIDLISEGLISSFAAMGFKIDRGNYFKEVPVRSEEELIVIANECERIFTDLYRINYNNPLEIEVEEFQ